MIIQINIRKIGYRRKKKNFFFFFFYFKKKNQTMKNFPLLLYKDEQHIVVLNRYLFSRLVHKL
jgi:hypothetical protein